MKKIAAPAGRGREASAPAIAERIRSEIVSGAIGSGTALNQVHLARRFGVSRIPVREALRKLEAEGYVLYRPNRPALVTELSVADVLEALEIRDCLEVALIRHAVRNLTAAAIDEAERILDTMRAVKNTDEVRGMHERFHSVLYQAACRPNMVRIVNENRLSADRTQGKTVLRSFVRESDAVHRELLASCRSRDARTAARCVREELELLATMIA